MNDPKKVLVVDDEPDAIKYVTAVLSRFKNYEIISSGTGRECLDKAQNQKPDLIILDIMLPDMDGFEVFYELLKNKETKNIPVIMLTGIADKVGIRFFKKDMKNYMNAEPVDYIEKPLDPEKLSNSVQKVFGAFQE